MKKRISVLFVFSSGFDIEHSSTILMTNTVEDALERGFDVHYIAPKVKPSSKNIPSGIKRVNELKHDSVLFIEGEKNKFVKRYLKLVKYAFDIRPYIKKHKDVDVIYVQSTPTAFWNILAVKSCIHKTPIIYSVLDMFPGSTIASGLMPNQVIQLIFYKMQKMSFNIATHIMTLSADMKEKVHECGVDYSKISCWDTWFDNKNLQYIEDENNTFISEYNIDKKNKFYIQYAGNVGYVFDVKTLIAVAKRLSRRNEFVFQLVARGSQLEYVKQQIEKYKLENIQILPIQPVSRISEVYSACDVQFIPLKTGVIGNSFPSKLAHVMAVGKTFICSIDRSPFFDEANNKKIGFCFEIGRIEAISKCIEKLYEDRKLLASCEENALSFASDRYSRDRNTKIILDTIEYIAKNKRMI